MMPAMTLHILTGALACTRDVRAASGAVVDHFTLPGMRPSVYVERGGRLRCQALSGYRQLLDGIPPWVGIIGRTYATGEATIVRDVEADPHYLGVTDGVRAQACFPVECMGRVVGVVSVEATERVDDAVLAEIEEAARLLGARIEALGGLAPESASQRLVRHAIALATQYDVAAIERAVVAAAVDITPLTSAVLLRRSSELAPFVPSRAHGPLVEVLTDAPGDALQAVAAFASAGCSSYTVSGTGAAENAGVKALRMIGAVSLAVLPAGPDRVLIVAGDTSFALNTEHCELLELLTAQASVCLRTAASVTALRAQAATDPLTGLGHHATFHAELADARDAGEVGVLVIDVDGFKAYNDRHGHPAGDRALRAVAEQLAGALRGGDALFRIGGDEFAALLLAVDGETALDVARRLHRAVAAGPGELSVSVGAAVTQPGEKATEVLARADRALYVVKARGRDGVWLDEDAGVEATTAH